MKSIKFKYVFQFILVISIISIINTLYKQSNIIVIGNSIGISLVGIATSVNYFKTGKINKNLLLLWVIPQILILKELVLYQGEKIYLPIFDVTQFLNITLGKNVNLFGKVFNAHINFVALFYLYVYIIRFRKSYLGLRFYSTKIQDLEVVIDLENLQGEIIEKRLFNEIPYSYIIKLKDLTTYNSEVYSYLIISDFNNDNIRSEQILSFSSYLLKSWDANEGVLKKDLKYIGIIEGKISKELNYNLKVL